MGIIGNTKRPQRELFVRSVLHGLSMQKTKKDKGAQADEPNGGTTIGPGVSSAISSPM